MTYSKHCDGVNTPSRSGFRESAGVPWTGLGYTYDWGNDDSDIGASDFILMPNAPYQIKQVLTTHEYCTK
ncbi:MAG: hypothetical protein NTW85_12405 [Methylococcales bacterium]|nr:hypothetical protein [Methylococcales bacterium]